MMILKISVCTTLSPTMTATARTAREAYLLEGHQAQTSQSQNVSSSKEGRPKSYSLFLLFVPSEMKPHCFEKRWPMKPSNVSCSAYHARLQAMLKVLESLKAITNARNLSAPEEHSDNKTLGRARDPRANGAWLNKLTE